MPEGDHASPQEPARSDDRFAGAGSGGTDDDWKSLIPEDRQRAGDTRYADFGHTLQQSLEITRLGLGDGPRDKATGQERDR